MRHGFNIQESMCRFSESTVLFFRRVLSMEGFCYPKKVLIPTPCGYQWDNEFIICMRLCFSSNFIIVEKLRTMFIHPRTQLPSWFPGDAEQICQIKKVDRGSVSQCIEYLSNKLRPWSPSPSALERGCLFMYWLDSLIETLSLGCKFTCVLTFVDK